MTRSKYRVVFYYGEQNMPQNPPPPQEGPAGMIRKDNELFGRAKHLVFKRKMKIGICLNPEGKKRLFLRQFKGTRMERFKVFSYSPGRSHSAISKREFFSGHEIIADYKEFRSILSK